MKITKRQMARVRLCIAELKEVGQMYLPTLREIAKANKLEMHNKIEMGILLLTISSKVMNEPK